MMTWHLPHTEFRGLRGHDLKALGIPTEEEYLEMYLWQTGFDAATSSEWGFYMAYNMFRMAGILQGVYARALQGNASSADALAHGRQARPMAEMGWKQVENILAGG